MTKTILIAEDNDDNRLIYTTLLRHAGYIVIEAVDGPSTLIAVRDHSPNLLLLDVSMPGTDGWEVCRELRKTPPSQPLAVVMLTAHALEQDRAHAFECGADGYLAKPVEPRVVLAEVVRWVGPAR